MDGEGGEVGKRVEAVFEVISTGAT